MSQLECTNLALGYEHKIVSQDIHMSLTQGDYLCIVGENGAGKSTLMKVLLGLKKPLSGKIKFSGDVKPYEIGYLPQQTSIQKDFPASVREVVLSGCINAMGLRPFYKKCERLRCEQSMEKLGIKELENRCYRELSGGQQQRVLLARALCATRKVLLLDEPVAGLDPQMTKEMYEVIDQLNKQEGISIIMISHDINEVVQYASHVLHMGPTPLFYGTKEAYMKEKKQLWEAKKEGN